MSSNTKHKDLYYEWKKLVQMRKLIDLDIIKLECELRKIRKPWIKLWKSKHKPTPYIETKLLTDIFKGIIEDIKIHNDNDEITIKIFFIKNFKLEYIQKDAYGKKIEFSFHSDKKYKSNSKCLKKDEEFIFYKNLIDIDNPNKKLSFYKDLVDIITPDNESIFIYELVSALDQMIRIIIDAEIHINGWFSLIEN